MVNDSKWFTQVTDKKIKINSIVIYKSLSAEILNKLDNNLSVREIINWIRNTTKWCSITTRL